MEHVADGRIIVAILAAQSRRLTALVAPFEKTAGVVGIAFSLLSAVILDGYRLFRGPAGVLPVIGAALVIIVGISESQAKRLVFLQSWPLVWIGKLSYSWDLWHLPLSVMVGSALPTNQTGDILDVGSALMLAAITYLFVEKPIRRRTRLNAPPYHYTDLRTLGRRLRLVKRAQGIVEAIVGRRVRVYS